MKEIIKSPFFWTGVQSVALLMDIAMFLSGLCDWKSTVIWGAISILSIGVNISIIKEREEE